MDKLFVGELCGLSVFTIEQQPYKVFICVVLYLYLYLYLHKRIVSCQGVTLLGVVVLGGASITSPTMKSPNFHIFSNGIPRPVVHCCIMCNADYTNSKYLSMCLPPKSNLKIPIYFLMPLYILYDSSISYQFQE